MTVANGRPPSATFRRATSIVRCAKSISPRSGQSLDPAGVAKRSLVRLNVVARDLCVHRTFEKETQHRVIGVIRLMESEHGGAVGLLLELVIPLGTRPQRLADRDVPRQFVELGLGHRFPRPPLAA